MLRQLGRLFGGQALEPVLTLPTPGIIEDGAYQIPLDSIQEVWGSEGYTILKVNAAHTSSEYIEFIIDPDVQSNDKITKPLSEAVGSSGSVGNRIVKALEALRDYRQHQIDEDTPLKDGLYYVADPEKAKPKDRAPYALAIPNEADARDNPPHIGRVTEMNQSRLMSRLDELRGMGIEMKTLYNRQAPGNSVHPTQKIG